MRTAEEIRYFSVLARESDRQFQHLDWRSQLPKISPSDSQQFCVVGAIVSLLG
ncbi:hypothetical protein [Altericista sp. CCNU0014]|uniref:hypothetical protein n=1 Tax=Altericista sp. CCNU0014 TaxID=3082949 RepID=UPI00384D1C29